MFLRDTILRALEFSAKSCDALVAHSLQDENQQLPLACLVGPSLSIGKTWSPFS